MHRREFLSASGALVLSGLAGCLFGGGDEPGRIEIHNDHSQDYTVTVTVEKTSEDDDDARGRTTYEILTPTSTPIRRREHTFEVSANSDLREAEFFTEGGAFFVEVELDSGATSATWISLYDNRGGVAETKLDIHINEDGENNCIRSNRRVKLYSMVKGLLRSSGILGNYVAPNIANFSHLRWYL